MYIDVCKNYFKVKILCKLPFLENKCFNGQRDWTFPKLFAAIIRDIKWLKYLMVIPF